MDGAGLGAGTSSNSVAAMRFEKASSARVLVAGPGLFFAPEGNRSRAAWHLMFVPSEALEEFTGLKRPSAQKRFLDVLGIKNIERLDGSLAVRQEEIDAHTLSKPPKDSKRRRTLNLSLLSKTG
jgi:hypothetical protein